MFSNLLDSDIIYSKLKPLDEIEYETNYKQYDNLENYIVNQNKTEILHKLNKDIVEINDMFNTMNNIVNIQNETLNLVDDNITKSDLQIKNSEVVIQQANDLQNKNIKTITFLYILGGTFLGASLGNVGILFGIKPVITSVVSGILGGGLGFFYSY